MCRSPSRQDGGGRRRLSSSREEAMKHRYTILALPALVCGTVVAGSDQAWSERPIDPDMRHQRPAVVIHSPPTELAVLVQVTRQDRQGASPERQPPTGSQFRFSAGCWRREHSRSCR